MNSSVQFLLILIFTVISCVFPHMSAAQNLLNLPESVAYDVQNRRYLVSSWENGNVVQIDSTGTQSYFSTGQHCHAGLHILDNVLYVACRAYGVKGFDLTTGANVLDVSIPEAANINDITADTSGYLYVSYPTGSQIFRVSIEEQSYALLVQSGLNTPNGLYFDEVNNRLLIVSYRYSSPVQMFDLADSTLSTVVSTSLQNLDGLTRDNQGNYYVSSWYSNACFKFDNTFSSPPELFSTHPDDPADIYFNEHENVLAVPLFFTHDVEFVSVPSAVEENIAPKVPADMTLFPNYPNPFNPVTVISFELAGEIGTRKHVSLAVYDLRGRNITTLIDSDLEPGHHRIVWDGSTDRGYGVSSGVYFYTLRSCGETFTRKMVLAK